MTIKELREKYNLTQSALARSLGVSSNAISGIEVGRIKLTPKMSAKIKEVYGEEVTTAPAPEKKAVAPVETTVVEKKAAPKKLAEAEAAPALEKKDDVESAVDEKAAEVATPAAPALTALFTSESESPTISVAPGAEPVSSMALSTGSGSGLCLTTLSPAMITAGPESSGNDATSSSVRNIGLLVTIPQSSWLSLIAERTSRIPG